MGKPAIIAHRGASSEASENTLLAIRRALEIGVDGIEVDVRLSADKHPVLMHDERVDRTTNGHGFVSEMSLEELKRLSTPDGEKIPTLEEALELVDGKCRLIVELKVPEAVEPALRAVKNHDALSWVIFSSFYHRALLKLSSLNPNVRTGVIVSSQPISPARLALDAKACAIFQKYTYLDRKIVDEAHEQGLDIYAWTVDNVESATRLASIGVDGIVTNRPRLLLDAFT